MKREFLEGLGLEKEVIDKVMAENGKDIEVEKTKTKNAEADRDHYKEQLDTANEKLERFKDVKPDELQQTIADLQKQIKDKDAEYAAKEADRAFKEDVEAAIKTAGGKNAKAIMALLDMGTLKESKNQKDDIKTALEELQKDNDYLFGSKEPIQNPTGPTNTPKPESGDSALRAAMGLPPLEK